MRPEERVTSRLTDKTNLMGQKVSEELAFGIFADSALFQEVRREALSGGEPMAIFWT